MVTVDDLEMAQPQISGTFAVLTLFSTDTIVEGQGLPDKAALRVDSSRVTTDGHC